MKKVTATILAFSIIALLGVSLIAAFPMGFGNGKDLTDEQKVEAQAFHDSVKQAIENNDFETWKTLMESQLTEENFADLVEQHKQMSEEREANQELRDQMREAMQSGDYETASQLREQLGQSTMGFEKGKHFGMRGEQSSGNNKVGSCPYSE